MPSTYTMFNVNYTSTKLGEGKNCKYATLRNQWEFHIQVMGRI